MSMNQMLPMFPIALGHVSAHLNPRHEKKRRTSDSIKINSLKIQRIFADYSNSENVSESGDL
jgi:hypothetical protein